MRRLSGDNLFSADWLMGTAEGARPVASVTCVRATALGASKILVTMLSR
jgi:hypothetical protein